MSNTILNAYISMINIVEILRRVAIYIYRFTCYSSIANGGYFERAKFVKQIIDKDGKVVYNRSNNATQVVDSDVNYLMLDNLAFSLSKFKVFTICSLYKTFLSTYIFTILSGFSKSFGKLIL